MTLNYYNNIGIGAVALGAVLNHSKELSITRSCLIFPLIAHKELLQHLCRKTTSIKSIEKLIVEKTSYFSNFNKRYYDSLVLTFNTLQYLNDTGYVQINEEQQVILVKPLEYDKKMGKRAGKIFDASKNIALLLQERTDKLYLNLRIEI